MKLKIALYLIGLSVSNIFAAGSVPQTDEERMDAALRLSIETAQAAEAFRAKQAAVAATPKSSIGNVAFEALMCNAGHVAGNSRNADEIQSMINQIRSTQGEKSLTEEQADAIDGMLVSLAIQMSAITTAQRLGA